MPRMSEGYRQLSRDFYGENPAFKHNPGWGKYAKDLIDNNGYSVVLDYGCGRGELAQALARDGLDIREYDPAIEGKDAEPEAAELVTCIDVFQHIEPVHVNAVIRHLRELTQKRLFIKFQTAPTGVRFPDGRDAHILVKPGVWWRKKLLEHFQILIWEERGPIVAAELIAKKHTGIMRTQNRREVPPQMRGYLGKIRDDINAASDAFSQIQTIRMWEGLDDEPADLQCACDIVQHMDDIDFTLADIAAKSLKCTFIGVKVDELRTAWDWKRVLERRFRAAQWDSADGNLMMIGAPAVSVQGVIAVGAVASDDRWVQVEAATKAIDKRIELAEPHDRVAVLACYGPSLADTICQLKELADDPNADIISVSGAHDFLIENGIIPRYHAECDPRPHKADNIDAGHPDITYLLASSCSPVLFDKLKDHDIRLWHVSTTEHVMKLQHELKENPRHIISGGGSVGLRAIPLLYALGYRKMFIFAMDCSFADKGETQHAGKHAGKKQDACEVLCDQRVFVSSPVLLTYATGFFETVQKVTDLDVRLYGDGLLQAMCRYYQGQGSVPMMDRIESAE